MCVAWGVRDNVWLQISCPIGDSGREDFDAGLYILIASGTSSRGWSLAVLAGARATRFGRGIQILLIRFNSYERFINCLDNCDSDADW